MCPLVKALEADGDIDSIVAVTAQHREMLDSALDYFGVRPKYDLNIMKRGQTLSTITADVILGLEELLKNERPRPRARPRRHDYELRRRAVRVLREVRGRTRRGRTAHLRQILAYPEEMNRCLTSRIAELHFAPTEHSRENLAAEGIMRGVYVTGNTALDAFKYTVKPD